MKRKKEEEDKVKNKNKDDKDDESKINFFYVEFPCQVKIIGNDTYGKFELEA